MRATMKVFNENGPRFCIFAGINVKNERNDMCLHLVNMHMQLRVILIQSKPIRSIGSQFYTLGPCFCIMFEFLQNAIGQIRSIDKECQRSINDLHLVFQMSCWQTVLNTLLQGTQQFIRATCHSKAMFGKVGYQKGGMHGLNVGFVAFAVVVDFFGLPKPFFHQLLPTFRVGIVIGERPRIVALVIFINPFVFNQSNHLSIRTSQITQIRP
mmetsp:Transcript_11316/g.23170  ORF Transcript_11316/g.23170 Transcript_11316/m.23170 type:complete len:211 (+) Transcript_11316:438-1070(+)